MNYKKKIQEIQTMINIINKYYINRVTNPSKETINRLEEINNRVEYINRVMNLLEKPTNLNQLKYLLKVIQIELDQL
jgi:hypothetical protein